MRILVLSVIAWLFLGVAPSLAAAPFPSASDSKPVVCGTDVIDPSGRLRTSANPSDPLVETRIVFVTFPSHSQSTKPTWAFDFRAEIADYVDKMSRGAQKLSALVVSPPADTTLAWMADNPGSYYKGLTNGYAVVNAEIMTEIANAIPGVWTGVEQVFVIHYEDIFYYGWAGLSTLGCFGTGCAPGFSGVGTTQIMLDPNPNSAGERQSTTWIASHEYGHTLGFGHSPNTHLAPTSCNYVNMGRYCTMRASGSFIREGGAVPYHPMHLLQAGWLTKTVISSDTPGLRVPPMFGANAQVFEVPIPGVSGQRYLIANFQQSNPYDTKYGNRGLLIWHVKDGVFWDLESAAGEFTELGECNLGAANPDNGSDLLEACFSHLGAPNNFFDGTVASQFHCSTNPHTKAQDGDYCSAQTTLTPVAFQNITRDPVTGEMVLDVYVTPRQNVTYPNGGEVIAMKQPTTVTWAVRPSACVSTVDVLLSTNGGANYTTLASGYPNSGSYTWTPTTLSSQARIQVRSYGGGTSATDESNANFIITDNSWQLLGSTHPSGGRSEHGAIYDSLRARMVIFGGHGASGNLNDVWAKPLLGTGAWTQITTSGTPPSARYNPAAVYDKARDRMIVFGGRTSGFSPLSDCFALTLYGTPTWSALPSSPYFTSGADRFGVYDSRRDRLVVVDPDIGTFALTLAGTPTWSQLGLAPPNIGQMGNSLIYDSARDVLVIFGGWTPSNNPYIYFNTVNEFSFATNTWTTLSTTNPPHPRSHAAAVYDPLRSRMVLFGGYYYEAGTDHWVNDIWALPLGTTPTWTQLYGTGTTPAPRRGHSGVYDSIDDAMAIFGGHLSHSSFAQDAHALVFPDIRPPAATWVGVGTGRYTAAVAWTYPGDDGMFGEAIQYDVRYSTFPLSEANWYSATSVSGPVTGSAGESMCIEVSGLSQCTWYYFAVKHVDDAGNWSPISNVAYVKTKCTGGIIVMCELFRAQAGGEVEAPKALSFARPSPNPAGRDVTFRYDVPTELAGSRLELAVFDVLGRRVKVVEAGEASAGTFVTVWDLRTASGERAHPGLYYTRLVVGDRTLRRSVLVR